MSTPSNVDEFAFLGEVWKHYDSEKYFENLKIPEDWNTLEDFVEWYMTAARMPFMIPYNARVMCSDDAVAICIFRKGHYQVELYLEYPEMYIRKHAHPRMEVITVKLGGGTTEPKNSLGLSKSWGQASKKLMPGEEHGGEIAMSFGTGFGLLAFQKWYDIEEMTSASVQWKGEIQGPKQQALIKSYKESAIVLDNYADVSEN